MRSSVWALSALIIFASAVRADEQSEALAVLDKAIKAQGGEDKLARMKTAVIQGKGTIHLGDNLTYTADVYIQGAEQRRFDMELNANGQTVTINFVVDGTKGWQKIANTTTEMNKAMIEEHRTEMYAQFVCALIPLKDKEFKLSPLGEVKVKDKPTIGIKVMRKGHTDVDLFFDKETMLLIKSEFRIVDAGGGMEVSEEFYFSDYRDRDGFKMYSKAMVHRDGKPRVDMEITGFKPAEKLPPGTFDKP